jgi:methyl-accepting chemotaxis protein
MKSSIRSKIVFLIAALSLAAFAGFGVFLYNAVSMQKISREVIAKYNEALTEGAFSRFDDFLNAIEGSSGISQALGETFYNQRNTLSREEITAAMPQEYHRIFAREEQLLGGGAFFEPYAFYPDAYDWHYFSSKVLTSDGVPKERDVEWQDSEWEWDVDTYEEGWYQIALPKGWDRNSPREDRYYWSDLYIDTSVDALMVSVCLPIYTEARSIVGVATVDVSLSTLQQMVASFTLPTPSSQIAGFSTINEATFAIGGSDNFDIVPYEKGTWLEQLSKLKPGQNLNENIVLDGETYSLYASVHDSGIGLAILVPNAEKFASVDAVQKSNLVTVVAVFLVMLLIIAIVILALNGWIIRPIKKVFVMLEAISTGDLTREVKAAGNDELGEMMKLLDRTREGIRSLIAAIDNKAKALSTVGDELSVMVTQSASAVKEISANTQTMKAKAGNQADSVNETNATMSQIISHIEDLNTNIEEQSESISTSSSAVDEMAGKITSITQSLIENKKNVQELAAASDEGNTAIRQVSNDIKDVMAESERLLEINQMIKNIANQTNLLAMNAAIEAAHAGEVGKGFAVVSDEIRKLAESSSVQSKTVSEVLKKIKTSLDGINGSTTKVLRHLDDIDRSVKTVSEQEETIRNAAEEQNAGSQEILEAMSKSNTITRNVRQGSEIMLSDSKKVIEEAATLKNLTAGLTSGMDGITQGMGQISTAVNRIQEISGENKDSIDVLIGEISKFKVK